MRREIFVSLAIVASAVGVALADDQTGVRAWLKVRSDLANAQARVAELEQRIQSHEGEAAALKSDPLAVERAIREDLGFARPGETVVRGLEPEAPKPGAN